MSVPDTPRPEPPLPAPANAGLGGCLVALLVLIGIVLLLPGICSLLFMVPFLLGQVPVGDWVITWLITFVIAAGGIALIRYALRNR